MAQKQADADFVLQRLNLPADGGLRQREFFRRDPKIQMPCYGLKSAQMPDREGAGAQLGFGGDRGT